MTTVTANKPRGEAVLDLGNRKVRMRMTLEAMAGIEDLFGIDSLADLETALQRPSSTKIGGLLCILAKGAGETLSLDDARKAPIALPDLFNLIGQAMGVAPPEGAPAPNA